MEYVDTSNGKRGWSARTKPNEIASENPAKGSSHHVHFSCAY